MYLQHKYNRGFPTYQREILRMEDIVLWKNRKQN